MQRQFAVEINGKDDSVWGNRRVQEIVRRDVVELLDRIVDRGSPVLTANRVFATVRKFFGWLVERDVLLLPLAPELKMPSAPWSSRAIGS